MITDLKSYISFIVSIFMFIFIANACTEEVTELSSANRVVADSLIRIQTAEVITEIDSLCGLVYQKNFDRAVDSVSQVRLKEIEQYIPSK